MGEQSCGCKARAKADRVHTDEGRRGAASERPGKQRFALIVELNLFPHSACLLAWAGGCSRRRNACGDPGFEHTPSAPLAKLLEHGAVAQYRGIEKAGCPKGKV